MNDQAKLFVSHSIGMKNVKQFNSRFSTMTIHLINTFDMTA